MLCCAEHSDVTHTLRTGCTFQELRSWIGRQSSNKSEQRIQQWSGTGSTEQDEATYQEESQEKRNEVPLLLFADQLPGLAQNSWGRMFREAREFLGFSGLFGWREFAQFSFSHLESLIPQLHWSLAEGQSEPMIVVVLMRNWIFSAISLGMS